MVDVDLTMIELTIMMCQLFPIIKVKRVTAIIIYEVMYVSCVVYIQYSCDPFLYALGAHV